MKHPESLISVAEFHTTFKHPIEEKPVIPSPNRCKLRVSLLQEELNELQEAIDNNDLVGIADALCDLQYVLSGAILEFGLGQKFKSLFDEVQRSNMSKACASIEEAEATVKHYQNNHNTACFYEESDGKYLVYRSEDRKTLKSIFYSPANLEKFI
jgi:predicted HAD superfamily Cof-like phosphohydrolase